MAWEEARAAKAAYEASLFVRANVVGVAVGRKVIRGRETDEPCVVVYVERKRPEAELRPGEIVPRVVDGMPTDVVETGRFRALAFAANESVGRTGRIRPAPGGVSLAHFRVSAGTLGVLVRHRDTGPMILSNNHVLANSNDARRGDPILQPGPADGGTQADAIARLAESVPIAFLSRNVRSSGRRSRGILTAFLEGLGMKSRQAPRDANLVDAAIAEPFSPDLVVPEILDIGRARGHVEAEIDARVRKSGRTTGLTTGRVTGIDAVVQVDYGGRSALFREQIVSDIPSRGGDSGSLVVDDDRRGVGLLFAGSPVTTLLNPIAAVLEALHLSL